MKSKKNQPLRVLLAATLSPIGLAMTCPAQASSIVAQQPPKSTPYRTSQIPCPTLVAPEEIEGKTTICGILTVPEDYSKPNGRQVELTYTIFKSRSLSPQPDPLLVLHGGPGGSDIAIFRAYTSFYESYRQTRDVILFDQRGSQFSGDLACSPTFIVLVNLTRDPKSELSSKLNALFNAFAKKFATTLPGDMVQFVELLAAQKICSQLLENHGFDLKQYNTANNARDSVNLASALGYEQVNLYGISYGTYLALRIMRDYPQRLRSVVLDSTIPPQVKKYETALKDFEVVTLNLLEDCQKDAACNAAYPNLKTRTIALLQALEKKPIPIAGSDKPVSVKEFSKLIESINTDLDARKAAYIPLIVSELEQGITTTYTGVVSGKIFPKPATRPIEIGRSSELLAKADEFRAQARKLLIEQATVAESQRPSQRWVQQVLKAIETLPEKDRFLARVNFYGVGFQQKTPRDRQTLITSIAEIFPVSFRGSLTQPLQVMAGAEIRHVYETLGTLFRSVISIDAVVTEGVFRSFDCQDLVPPSDTAQTAATFQSMQMPGLGQERFSAAKQAYAICQFWPVKPAPVGDREVVRSTVTTLVLQSRYDTETNTTVGRQAMAGLTNGTFLEFPNSGHGALLFSQCARDVGAAFVNNPSRFPKAECRESLKPKFVLPPAK